MNEVEKTKGKTLVEGWNKMSDVDAIKFIALGVMVVLGTGMVVYENRANPPTWAEVLTGLGLAWDAVMVVKYMAIKTREKAGK